jgi:precorrin-2 dehydrogenase/sirohydrochlorin ferrochelatase
MPHKGIALYFRPQDLEVLVVGGGKAAKTKVQGLNRAGLSPLLVTREFRGSWDGLHLGQALVRPYNPADLRGKRLVYACTDDLALNKGIALDCHRQNILCSPAGLAQEGDFYSMAQWSWEGFTLALSSGGEDRKALLALKYRIQEALEDMK